MAFDITPGFNMPGFGDVKRAAGSALGSFAYGGQQGAKQPGPTQDWIRRNTGVLGSSTTKRSGGGAKDSSVPANNPTNPGVTGGGSGGGSPAYDPGDLAYLDSQQELLDRQLGRTDTGLRQALEQLLNSYNKEVSGANKQRGRALEDFSTKRQTSEMGRERELDKVGTNSRMLADSLRQRIGLASGKGSSAYQIAAPRAVQRQASEQRGDVLEDYSANFLNLDRDETRAKEDFASLLEDLAAQRKSREGGVRSDILEQRNEIQQNRSRVAGERAKLLGGGYDSVRQAMSPYEAAIRSGESAIDQIFDKYTTKYNVKPVQVRNTQLRDYATDQAAVRDNAATGSEDPYAPYKNYADEDEEQPLL